MSKLELVWRAQGEPNTYGSWYTKYLDFVIDGRSLRDMLDMRNRITYLGSEYPDWEREAIAQMLLREKSPLPSGRIPLFVCSCGGLDCGAATVRIERTPQGVLWHDFSFETDEHDYLTRTWHRRNPSSTWYRRLRTIGPFLFNKSEYWHTFAARLGELAE